MKCRDGFRCEQQLSIPEFMLNRVVRQKELLHSFYITHIGYFLKAKYHYQEEKHSCKDYIIIYCQYGKGTVENRHGKQELLPNQFVILPPNEFYCLKANIDDPWSIYFVHFNSHQSEVANQEFHLDKYYEPTDIFYHEQILEVWHQMHEHLARGYTTFSILNANLSLYSFLSFFLFQQEFPVAEKEDLLDKSIRYMKSNLSKRLMVDEIASFIQYSPSHYTALFKRKTGMTPLDYFIKMKIRYACRLLIQNELKVKEIAQLAGYEDPYFFSKIFKQVTGKSPKEYKQTKRMNLLTQNL